MQYIRDKICNFSRVLYGSRGLWGYTMRFGRRGQQIPSLENIADLLTIVLPAPYHGIVADDQSYGRVHDEWLTGSYRLGHSEALAEDSTHILRTC